MANLPEQFKQHMQHILGDEYNSFIDTYERPTRVSIRVNTLKTDESKLKELLGFDFAQMVPWCGDGFYYDEMHKLSKSPFYNSGLFYIQEASAMAPASILEVLPGMKVLDMCAAPGGKSTHLAAKMQNKGLLIANDISASRCGALTKNLELFGITNATVTSVSPDVLVKNFPNFFNAILIDAPCSGEGMFRKDKAAVKVWSIDRVQQFKKIQRNLLDCAAQMVEIGGKIMYSTCTFNLFENEQVIEDFLSKHDNFEMINIDHKKLGIQKGFSINGDVASGCGRILPHNHPGEGHFLAYMRKKGSGLKQEIIYGKADRTRYDAAFKPFLDFVETNLNTTLSTYNLMLHKNSLFTRNGLMPQTAGIRVVKGQFHLGDFKGSRTFVPSTALALSLKPQECKRVINFEAGSDFVRKYLKGESFDYDGADGYTLVCVDGFALGWGKVDKGYLKNKYNRYWLG